MSPIDEKDILRISLGIPIDKVKTDPVVAPLLRLTTDLIKRNHQMELQLINYNKEPIFDEDHWNCKICGCSHKCLWDAQKCNHGGK